MPERGRKFHKEVRDWDVETLYADDPVTVATLLAAKEIFTKSRTGILDPTQTDQAIQELLETLDEEHRELFDEGDEKTDFFPILPVYRRRLEKKDHPPGLGRVA